MGESGLGVRAPRRREAPPRTEPTKAAAPRGRASKMAAAPRARARGSGRGGGRGSARRRLTTRPPPVRGPRSAPPQVRLRGVRGLPRRRRRRLRAEQQGTVRRARDRRARPGPAPRPRRLQLRKPQWVLPPRAPRPGYRERAAGAVAGRGAGAGAGWDLPNPGRRGGRGSLALGLPGAPLPSTHARVAMGHRSAGIGSGG